MFIYRYVVTGKYNVKISIDDDIDMTVEAYNLQGGQYKKIVDRKLEKFCQTLYVDTFKGQYARFYEASTVKIPFGTCPYPAGDNEMINMMITDEGQLPAYIPGSEKWRVDIRFLKKEEILGGYNVYGLIRSEQSLMAGG